ncbi:hypothetical protein BGZ96_012057 [Linnemannia gamsii]|uniref:F-box domain-containing protein n=1 Tax=Linnemannia gamsii TaxID=64522 RepID=A0ABQ7JR26_9FUNG|nr:hypothetical protein BGZ96_012057 [Linnemannia gamsii]
MDIAKTGSPFDIPELRHQLSRYVSAKTAWSCIRVSKAWAATFIPVIWFEVDFALHPEFASLQSPTVGKHGGLIRVIKNAKSLSHVSVLANIRVNQLRSLHVETTASVLQHEYAYEVVSRNKASLQHINLYASTVPTNKRSSLAHFVSAPALIICTSAQLKECECTSVSVLKSLTLSNLCLTGSGFMSILLASPMLEELRLLSTDVVGAPNWWIQHSGIKLFVSWLKNIIRPDTDSADGPSLLAYLPALNILNICDHENQSASLSAEKIKKDLAQYCPNLTVFHLQDSSGAIIPKFCYNAPNNLTEIVYMYHYTSPEVLTSILLHQNSLKAVSVFCSDNIFSASRHEVIPVNDHFQASGRLLQLIPRGCPQLEVLSLHLHEMDMDEVEKGEWACKKLRTLRVRIKGLDTQSSISKALSLWYADLVKTSEGSWSVATITEGSMDADEKCGSGEGGGDGGNSSSSGSSLVSLDKSIEARVARHLLKFEKLETVWLGYKTWSLR